MSIMRVNRDLSFLKAILKSMVVVSRRVDDMLDGVDLIGFVYWLVIIKGTYMDNEKTQKPVSSSNIMWAEEFVRPQECQCQR